MTKQTDEDSTVVKQTKRLTILTPEEIYDIYAMPKLNDEEREYFLSMNEQEKKLFDSYRDINAKIFFVLQLGHFKAKKLFFAIHEKEVNDDVKYILNLHFRKNMRFDATSVSASTIKYQRQSILKLHGYRYFSGNLPMKIADQIEHAVKICIKPVFLFQTAIKFLEREKVVIPSYQTLQDLIGREITKEYRRIEDFLNDHLTKATQKRLAGLVSNQASLYELTLMKKDARDFRYGEVKKELRKRQKLEKIYREASKILPLLQLSNSNIQYYASLVDYYSVTQLKNLASDRSRLYLLCYGFLRFQKVNDNLIKTFLYLVNNYKEQGRLAAKERILEHKENTNDGLKRAGKIWRMFTDENISDETLFGIVRKMAFKLLKKDQFTIIQHYIEDVTFDKSKIEWEEWEKLAPKFKKNIRQLVAELSLDSEQKNDGILSALDTIKRSVAEKIPLGIMAKSLPTDIITQEIMPYIISDNPKKKSGGKPLINFDRYEFFVYDQIKDRLDAGDIYCKDSVEFKSFSSDLIKRSAWTKSKNKILKDNGLLHLDMSATDFLQDLQKELASAYKRVNDNIESSKNKHIKVKDGKKGIKWTLPYQKVQVENNQIFANVHQISINDLLNFIDKKCSFSEAFTHITGHKQKKVCDLQPIFASIIALGTNLGLNKMAAISDMSLGVLRTATGGLLRLETLKQANDIMINEMALLPSFLLHHVSQNVIHSGSDGQKFETKFPTMKSRYSPKYFGLNKGIVCYTLVADHIPINAKIIGANEHESHFVFDILANNTSDIKPDIHSTDSHGINNANFFILDSFGYKFAPRYKNLQGKTETRLVGFADMKKSAKDLIKPCKTVDEKLFVDEWDNLKRIIASLAVKETTQSTLIKKLCSFKGQNRTKSALWEVDSIFETLYILDYIDDVNMRCNVQKALNRVESYHKLRKAIEVAHQGQSRAKTELDLHIWNECSRLLANAVIYFNHLLMSQMMERSGNKREIIKQLQSSSPVAWSHINFYGWYQFSKIEEINIDNILNNLEFSISPKND